jgi:acetyl esterase/lipase
MQFSIRSMRLGRLVGMATLAVALAACSTTAVLNAVQPDAGISVTHGQRYQPGPRGTLDVYRPALADGTAPIVLFLYGGSWDRGEKADYAFVGKALAAAGLVTVIADYRLYPQVRWPAYLQDNARALRWTKQHAAQFGGDPADIFLMGHSAGAYEALMLTLDPRWLAAEGLDPRRDLRGTIGLAGPYDFLPLTTPELQSIFGTAPDLALTQPINYVTGNSPPLFLGTDTADKVVDPGNTTRLAAKMRAAGGSVQVRYYRHMDHALLLGVFGVPLRFLAPVRRDVLSFIRAHAASGYYRGARDA